jgi:hypothetical protein
MREPDYHRAINLGQHELAQPNKRRGVRLTDFPFLRDAVRVQDLLPTNKTESMQVNYCRAVSPANRNGTLRYGFHQENIATCMVGARGSRIMGDRETNDRRAEDSHTPQFNAQIFRHGPLGNSFSRPRVMGRPSRSYVREPLHVALGPHLFQEMAFVDLSSVEGTALPPE